MYFPPALGYANGYIISFSTVSVTYYSSLGVSIGCVAHINFTKKGSFFQFHGENSQKRGDKITCKNR